MVLILGNGLLLELIACGDENSNRHSLHKSRVKVDLIVESGGLRLDLVRDDGLFVYAIFMHPSIQLGPGRLL